MWRRSPRPALDLDTMPMSIEARRGEHRHNYRNPAAQQVAALAWSGICDREMRRAPSIGIAFEQPSSKHREPRNGDAGIDSLPDSNIATRDQVPDAEHDRQHNHR